MIDKLLDEVVNELVDVMVSDYEFVLSPCPFLEIEEMIMENFGSVLGGDLTSRFNNPRLVRRVSMGEYDDKLPVSAGIVEVYLTSRKTEAVFIQNNNNFNEPNSKEKTWEHAFVIIDSNGLVIQNYSNSGLGKGMIFTTPLTYAQGGDAKDLVNRRDLGGYLRSTMVEKGLEDAIQSSIFKSLVPLTLLAQSAYSMSNFLPYNLEEKGVLLLPAPKVAGLLPEVKAPKYLNINPSS